MDGTKKCTYIILSAAGNGAPAFIVKEISTPADFTFDLHFAEWKDSDITFMPVSGNSSPFYGNYDANTYPNPLVSAKWNTG